MEWNGMSVLQRKHFKLQTDFLQKFSSFHPESFQLLPFQRNLVKFFWGLESWAIFWDFFKKQNGHFGFCKLPFSNIILFNLFCWLVLEIISLAQFLDAQASLAPTHLCPSVRRSVTLSNFHSTSVSGCSTWQVEESGPQLFFNFGSGYLLKIIQFSEKINKDILGPYFFNPKLRFFLNFFSFSSTF